MATTFLYKSHINWWVMGAVIFAWHAFMINLPNYESIPCIPLREYNYVIHVPFHIHIGNLNVVITMPADVLQYIPRNMHTVFALLCFVVVIHWLIFPYPSGLLHWHCGNLTIAPVPAKQPWWIWINTSCEFIMNDCITTTKQSTKNRVHISWDVL